MLTDNCVSGLTSACAYNVQTSRLLWLSLLYNAFFGTMSLHAGGPSPSPPPRLLFGGW